MCCYCFVSVVAVSVAAADVVDYNVVVVVVVIALIVFIVFPVLSVVFSVFSHGDATKVEQFSEEGNVYEKTDTGLALLHLCCITGGKYTK